MAGAKVRGITIDLGVDASGVASGLKSVDSAIKSTGRELKDIEKLLKLDPSNVTLLAQKHSALQRQVANTRDKLDLLKKAEEELKAQMVDGGTEEQQKQLAALQREIISTEKNLEKYENQLEETGSETKDLSRAEEQAEQATEKLSGGFSVLKGAMANLIADGIRKAVDGFKDLMTAAPEFADEILTLSKQTGLATDTLQEFEYMSGLIDVDVSTIAGSMKKLTKSMDSARGGTGATAEAFSTLGVSVTDANGQLRDNEDVFYDTIDALGKVQNETERDALAMQIFGKSATDLNPLIEAGSDAMKGFADEARDMGYVLDESSLDALGRVQDAFDRFGKQMEGVKNQIGAEVAPAIERGMKKLSEVVKKIDWKKIGQQMGNAFEKLIDAFDWIIEHGALIKSLLTGIVTALAVNKVMSFVSSISSMTSALKSATTAQKGLNAAANANPYILLATAIIGVTSALVSYGKSLLEANYNASLHVQRAKELIEASDQLIDATNGQVDAYHEAEDARKTSIDGSLAEIAQVQKLSDELRTLADDNGVVAESDQARAQFILNELNGALGTEFSINNGIIDQYGVLTDSVDTLIQRQQAMIVLEAQKDAYVEALQNQAIAEQTLSDLELQRIDLLNQQAMNQERINELNDYIENSGQYNGAFTTELANLTTAQTELEGKLQDVNAAYDEQSAVVDGYAYNIQAYMDNATAAINEDWDSITYKSFDMASETEKASMGAAKAISTNAQESADAWMQGVSDMLTESTGKDVEFENLGNGYCRMLVNGVQQGKNLPINEVKLMAQGMVKSADAQKSMEVSGLNAVLGFSNSVHANAYLASGAGRELATEFINSVKATLDEGSPSRVMAHSGLMAILGFTNEINDELQLVEQAGINMATAFTDGFSPNANYSSMLSGSLNGVQVPSAMVNGANSNMNTNNAVTINVYGAEGQNVNALADEVIDKLQRTLIGSEAVYA